VVDDKYLFALSAYPPDARSWRFHSESNLANCFRHEISNVVLPAVELYPAVLQVAEAGPLIDDSKIREVVDVTYTVGKGATKQCVLIVEIKRNRIRREFWAQQGGRKPDNNSAMLGRGLRG
jgi:hypothetical protein